MTRKTTFTVLERASKRIELRSDTFTMPTMTMREAMVTSPLGDDVYGEDPTVNRLEKEASALFQKENALFVPSGTMSNLLAIKSQCIPGEEVILGKKSHIFQHEGGGIASIAGVHSFPLPNQPDGTIDLEHIPHAIRVEDPHFPRSKMLCLENTHNLCFGQSLPASYIKEVGKFCTDHSLLFHIDGARIFHAAIDQGIEVGPYTDPCTSISVCLSKGLGAPVGSLLIGSDKMIYEARRWRKVLGGGMRQAGVLAAAGLVALTTSPRRLIEDHQNSLLLAEGLREIPGIEVRANHTNMVWFTLDGGANGEAFTRRLRENHDIWLAGMANYGGEMFRAVLHQDVSREQVHAVLDAVKQTLQA